MGTAVLLPDDHILGHVYQTAGQVTGVRGTKGGVGQALSGAAGGDEVFKYVEALTVVGADRNLDDLTGGVGDQAAHTGKLTNLADGTTGTGVSHHGDRIIDRIQMRFQGRGNLIGGRVPDIGDHVGAFLIGDETAAELLDHRIDLRLGIGKDLLLLLRDGGIHHGHGQSALGRILKALGLDLVEHVGGNRRAMDLDAPVDDLAQLLFLNQEVDLQLQHGFRGGAIHIAQVLRNGIVEDNAAHGGVDDAGIRLTIYFHGAAHLDGSVQPHHAFLIGHKGLVKVAENLALALFAGFFQGQVVRTEHHVLGRDGDRPSVGGLQKVVSRQHQRSCLSLGLGGQRHVHGHLVTVEVGVISGTGQRMQL